MHVMNYLIFIQNSYEDQREMSCSLFIECETDLSLN